MSSERFNEVARIFHEANRLPPDGRSEYLDHACRGDAALRQEVMELLVHDDAGAGDVLLGRLEGQMEVETAATVPPPRTSMPKQIGPYHIKSVIDTGGMATVYLGVQDQPRRHVAVKVMRRRIASSSNLRRFQYESQILARLRHPNIAKVYQAGVHTEDGEEVPYFAMEYVPNPKSITKYARSTKLGTRERLNLFAKVCDAVDHGHGKGIIHRDLKPGNILVDSNGDPKIIDFGVARATDSDMAVTTQQTDVGQLVGTLQYMSPEQCEADPDDLDIRSDVYALGVVLYELLTDQLPYDLTKAVIFEAMQVIRETPPVRPSSVDRTLRGDLETITLKALEKDRRHRYRSAADLGDDIAHYLNDEPIEARQQSMTYFVSKYMRRHKAGVVIVGLITLSAVLGVAAIIGLLAANAAQARADATLAQAEIDLLEAANAARREEVLGNLRSFTRELDDILEESPGALLARVLIARRVLRDVDRVTNDGSVDPEVLLASARAHRDLSTVLGSRRNPSLGEHEEAIRHLDEAQADVDQILEGDPDSRPARLELAAIHLSIGDMLDVRREYEAAAEHVMEAETILRKLVDEQNDFEIRRLHAVALTAVGASQVRRNDFEASRETYTEALIAFERLAAEHPDDVRLKRDCSVVYIRLGARLGDLDQRRELYRKALDIREDLLAGGQLNNRERRDVAQNYLLLGNEFVRSDDLAEAIRYLDQYVDLTIELAWESPFDARAQNDLARAHEWIPDLFDETGATQQAILRLWLCRRPLRLLAERVPARRGLASTNLEQLGALLEEQGDADSARQMYTEAIDLVRALHAETRKREHRLQLARQLTRQGISLLELDGNAARAFLEEAIRLFGTEDEDSALDEEQLEWRRRAEDALGTTG